MRSAVLLALTAAVAVNTAYVRNARRAIPQELFRDNVEPSKGGKVPEAAHMRIELNKLDAAGLESGEGVEMMRQLMASDITLPEKAGNQYNPGYSPPLKLKPGYAPKPAPLPSQSYAPQPYSPPQSAYSPNPYQPQGYEPYSPEPAYAPKPYSPPKPSYVPEPYAPNKPAYTPEPYSPPKPAYTPEPYSPPKPAYSPAPYSPPAPEYHKPVGPVLLEERPYEVKSVQALPISVSQSYTSFDCRQVAYPDRHYADPETGCEVYHFCHADGKQDTFHCGYGTVFNEYLGTCDYKNNVHCGAAHAPAPHAPVHAAHAPVHAASPYQDFGPFGYN